MEQQKSKKELRRSLLEQAGSLPESVLAASDRAIAARLSALPGYQRAASLFIYVSVKREPDTRQLIEAALAQGKKVAVPLCRTGGRMEARQIQSLSQLRPAAFGLLEPQESAGVVPPEEIDFVVVPCVACDQKGRRLGYGGGYYDRYLAQSRGWFVACLCREEMLVEQLPAEPHDILMPCIVTEKRSLWPGC